MRKMTDSIILERNAYDDSNDEIVEIDEFLNEMETYAHYFECKRIRLFENEKMNFFVTAEMKWFDNPEEQWTAIVRLGRGDNASEAKANAKKRLETLIDDFEKIEHELFEKYAFDTVE